jgi:DNA-binding transcriptional MerR regulator
MAAEVFSSRCPLRRTPGGRRTYTAVDVDWLRICVRLRESGMPLADLTRFAALVRQGRATRKTG